jgi:hypothetical protein
MDEIKLGNWQIKVSTLVDQILIICLNINKKEVVIKIFYNEIEAYEFMELI